jgi:hypothetical protein
MDPDRSVLLRESEPGSCRASLNSDTVLRNVTCFLQRAAAFIVLEGDPL